MKVEIETHDHGLLAALMQVVEPPVGSEVNLPGNATLRYLGDVRRTGVLPGMPEVLEFTLTLGKDVLVSMVATWLYERLCQRAETVRLGKNRVAVRESDAKNRIRKCVEENEGDAGDEEDTAK